MASYYRRFIDDFAKIHVASPFHSFTRKSSKFVWTIECLKAFELLKKKLTCTCTCVSRLSWAICVGNWRKHPGTWGHVVPKAEECQLHTVAYASHLLSKNYSFTELETIAVVWAMKHFNAYIYSHEVTVITDHTAVKAVLEAPHPSRKHTQWWLKVFGSGVKRLNIICWPGRENTKADSLSRNPKADLQPEQSEIGVQITQTRSFIILQNNHTILTIHSNIFITQGLIIHVRGPTPAMEPHHHMSHKVFLITI